MGYIEDLERHEVPEKEVYGIGVRIPLFKIKEAELDPQSQILTYRAQFTLETQILPDLQFSVSLGHPFVGGHINRLVRK